MRVSERRLYISYTPAQFAHSVQRDVGDDELGGESMPQVVPAQMPEAGICEQPVLRLVHVVECHNATEAA